MTVVGHPARQGARALAAAVADAGRAQAAEELGIPVLRPATINDPEVIEEIAGVGRARRSPSWRSARSCATACSRAGPAMNVHFSLLPAYRGAAPVERAIMDGVTETGVTIMQMDAGLDTGPMLAVARGSRSARTRTRRSLLGAPVSELGGPLLAGRLDDLEAGRLRPVPQPEEGVSLRAQDHRRGPRRSTSRAPPPSSRAACGRCRPTSARRCRIDGAALQGVGARGRCPSRCRRRRSVGRGRPAGGRDRRGVAGAARAAAAGQGPHGRGRFLRGWRGPLDVGRPRG